MRVIIRGVEPASSGFLKIINMGKSKQDLAHKLINEYMLNRFNITMDDNGVATLMDGKKSVGKVLINYVDTNSIINGASYKTKLKEFREVKEKKV